MSARSNNCHSATHGALSSTAGPAGRSMSSMMVCPAEVAMLRVSSKPGAEGNELILRSGISVPLTYAEAVEVRECLRLEEAAATNARHQRKMLLEIEF